MKHYLVFIITALAILAPSCAKNEEAEEPEEEVELEIKIDNPDFEKVLKIARPLCDEYYAVWTFDRVISPYTCINNSHHDEYPAHSDILTPGYECWVIIYTDVNPYMYNGPFPVTCLNIDSKTFEIEKIYYDRAFGPSVFRKNLYYVKHGNYNWFTDTTGKDPRLSYYVTSGEESSPATSQPVLKSPQETITLSGSPRP